MPFSHLLLLVSFLALVLTKIADLLSTLRGLRASEGDALEEQNPYARAAMQRWGVHRGLGAIMLLWALIVLVCYTAALIGSPAHRYCTASLGFLIAWAQAEAARFNATKFGSWFTRLVLRHYRRLR